jgi:hypothetical protein
MRGPIVTWSGKSCLLYRNDGGSGLAKAAAQVLSTGSVRAAGLPALLFEEGFGFKRARRQSREPENRRSDDGRDNGLHG